MLTIAAVYVGSRVAAGFGRDVRAAIFHRVTDFSAREVGRFGAPSLITRVTNDVAQVQMLVQMTCTLLIAAPITAVFGVVMASQEDVALTWIPVIAIPILLLVVGNVIARMVPTYRVLQDRTDGINRVLREQIAGVRVVRAFVRERYETEKFDGHSEGITITATRGGRLFALMFPTANVVVNLSSVAVLWFGAQRVGSGEMKAGAMVAFIQYLTQILMSVMMATFIGALAPRASVSSERIVEVLDTPPSITVKPGAVTEFTGAASVELRGAGFRYPGAEHPVLSGISLRVDAGQTLAVVGSTGSGKTTLVNLVARLMDVTEGSVQLHGVDVRDLDTDLLWHRIGLVP